MSCLSYGETDPNITHDCIGAIVAIQDVHQHLYFAVESEENIYGLGGATHYSLVGKRALFRVCNC